MRLAGIEPARGYTPSLGSALSPEGPTFLAAHGEETSPLKPPKNSLL